MSICLVLLEEGLIRQEQCLVFNGLVHYLLLYITCEIRTLQFPDVVAGSVVYEFHLGRSVVKTLSILLT